MKRTLIAFLLALGLHGGFLNIESSWFKNLTIKKPRQRVLTMTLSFSKPQRPVTPLPAQPMKKKPERAPIPKPEMQKPAKVPVQKTKKDLVKTIPEKSLHRHFFPSESERFRLIKIPENISEKFPEETPEQPSTKGIKAAVKQAVRLAKPLYRINPPPKYPEMARRRGFEGNVILEVLVGSNGSVLDLRIASPSGYPILDKAAVRSVKNWVFDPGMKGEKIVEMWVKVPIRFELK